MEQPLRKRAERSDKGRVRENPRDTAALTWLAQMYGAPLDVLADLLETTQAAARKVVLRWEKAGWVHRGRPVAGPEWVWPAPSLANKFLREGETDSSYGGWRPSPTLAAHTRAVAEVRLALAGPDLEAWLSERQIAHRAHSYKQAGQKLEHIPDGVWHRGGSDESDNVIIEVELTAKHPKRVQTILHSLMSAASERGASEVWYVVGSGHVRGVVERASRALRERTNEQWTRKLRVVDLGDVIKRSDGREH